MAKNAIVRNSDGGGGQLELSSTRILNRLNGKPYEYVTRRTLGRAIKKAETGGYAIVKLYRDGAPFIFISVNSYLNSALRVGCQHFSGYTAAIVRDWALAGLKRKATKTAKTALKARGARGRSEAQAEVRQEEGE